MTAPGSFDAAITAALDAQAGHLLNLTVEVCSCGRPWTDVRDWARHRMAEGLGAALTVLEAGIRADERAKTAEEIATAIEQANDAGAWVGVVPHEPAILAYDHCAALARLLRVPDCGDQYHGADGGPCSRCGFDVADVASSGGSQIAVDASEPSEGRSGHPDLPDAAETGTGAPVPPSREVAHAEIEDRTHPDVTAHAKYAYDVLFGHRPDTTQED